MGEGMLGLGAKVYLDCGNNTSSKSNVLQALVLPVNCIASSPFLCESLAQVAFHCDLHFACVLTLQHQVLSELLVNLWCYRLRRK